MIQECGTISARSCAGMSDSAIPNRIYRDDPRYGWENYWRVDVTTI